MTNIETFVWNNDSIRIDINTNREVFEEPRKQLYNNK